MPHAILDGLALVDTTGHFILATTLGVLVLGIAANLLLRARYAALERDLRQSADAARGFTHRVLREIVRDAEGALRRSHEVNTQAIIEDHFQAHLKTLLFAERFVRAATGLVIILGLLGTFYGLTLSIGRLVQLVSNDTGGVADISQTLTTGLTQALMGMAVAFSNSLLGIASAIVLTLLGVFSSVTDRRVGLMIQIETYLDRLLPVRAARGDASTERTVADFGASVARLDGCVARFEAALQALVADTRDLRQFTVQVVATKSDDRR